jgi:ABC-2 type transport system ATP-binding protein
MDEAYELCDEIAIMDRGKIIAQGTPKALLEKHFNDMILQLPKSDLVSHQDNLPVTALDCGDHVEIHTSDVNAVIQTLLANDVSLKQLQIRGRTLDDLFLELTGKDLRAGT